MRVLLHFNCKQLNLDCKNNWIMRTTCVKKVVRRRMKDQVISKGCIVGRIVKGPDEMDWIYSENGRRENAE